MVAVAQIYTGWILGWVDLTLSLIMTLVVFSEIFLTSPSRSPAAEEHGYTVTAARAIDSHEPSYMWGLVRILVS